MTAGRYTIAPEGRAWAVHAAAGELVALTVYKRGAAEVVRRLEAAEAALRAVAAEVTPGRRPLSSDSWLPSEIVGQVLAALADLAEGGQP